MTARIRRVRVVGQGGIVRWVPDPVEQAKADADEAAMAKIRAATRLRHTVDRMVTLPEVWERIAEHAEEAARLHPDDWATDVFIVLSGCARILAAGPDPRDEAGHAASTPVDDGMGLSVTGRYGG